MQEKAVDSFPILDFVPTRSVYLVVCRVTVPLAGATSSGLGIIIDCNAYSSNQSNTPMSYNFASLSPADFEDLARDLVGREIGVRFEAFGAGPDGGIDGRNAKGTNSVVLQAKHYVGSRYEALKREIKREAPLISQMGTPRYTLATSRPLSPRNKSELAQIIGAPLQSESDIFGPGDLNGILRRNPKIEKSHIKLWLSSSAVLDRVIRSAAHSYNNLTKQEIETKVRVYASNPSFNDAKAILEDPHVLIISGPPGVGKTTLAEMLSYSYLAEGWELIAIRSLDDGLASIDDSEKQIFFFDDFLGKVALDKRALSSKDSDLAKFLRRVRASPNARFILTTRAYIFEEARRTSEYLADRRLDISKFVLDVGFYTRRIKARILYNHLIVARTPKPYVTALIASGEAPRIVDHKNYNPRIIEWMTDRVHIGKIDPSNYPKAFLNALDNPSQLWDIAFRTHIPRKCQNLAFSLFFSSEYGVTISRLKTDYDALHPHLCATYGDSHDAKDFEEALHILEGGFISISDQTVSFINPSLRDYLDNYLRDKQLIFHFAEASQNGPWASAVWRHKNKITFSRDEERRLALAFLPCAHRLVTLPTREIIRTEIAVSHHPSDLPNIERLELMLDWYEACEDPRLEEFALAIAAHPVSGLDSWRDGPEAIELIGKLRDGDYYCIPRASEIADRLEEAAIVMVEQPMPSDELERIAARIDSWEKLLDQKVLFALDDAIRGEITNVRDVVSEIDSDSTLSEHLNTLKKLSARVAIPTEEVNRAVAIIEERIAELDEQTEVFEAPSAKIVTSPKKDVFNDADLNSLFACLLAQEPS